MIVFLESPMPWIFLGIVLEGILGVVFFTNRRGAVLLAMVGVLLVVVGLVVQRFAVTERKRVRTMLDSAVAAIQANDADLAEQFLAQSANDTLKRLRYYMGLVEFEEIHISNVQIEINRLTSPPTADVRLWGMAKFHDRLGISPYRAYPSWYSLVLVKEPDGWKVEDVRGDPQNPLRSGETE